MKGVSIPAGNQQDRAREPKLENDENDHELEYGFHDDDDDDDDDIPARAPEPDLGLGLGSTPMEILFTSHFPWFP